MRKTWKVTLAAAMTAAVIVASSLAAGADDPRCSRPPYGGSPDRYRAILETYKQDLASVDKLLVNICNMKFSGADRSELHKLGFTDQNIDSADTETLAVDVLIRTKGR